MHIIISGYRDRDRNCDRYCDSFRYTYLIMIATVSVTIPVSITVPVIVTVTVIVTVSVKG